ncbi:MAG TPA: class I adenylate-forming enzyme family protein [Myxococcota bacterium]
MSEVAAIEARLTAPGGPFETALDVVLGERMPVFRTRPPSLRALLAASIARGDAEYLVVDDGRRYGFAEHARRVAALAATLRERFGVGPGDRVAILAANGPEWIHAFWATVSLGAVCVGLNGWWVGDEIRHGLEDSEPRLLIGDRKRLERLGGAPPRMPVVEIESEFEALVRAGDGAALPDVPIAEDDPATILYTSGTTGRPKGAVTTHRAIVALAQLQAFHGMRMFLWAAAQGRLPSPEARAAAPPPCNLVATPLFHVSGLYTGVVTGLAHGIKSVWTTGRFDPVKVMQLIERERVTSWGPMGTMVHRVVHHPEVGRYDLSTVTTIGSGGAPIAPALLARMREVFPNARASLGLGYGLTESGGLATLIWGEELEARPGSVGRALPTVQIAVHDPDGKPVPPGVEGEVWIRSPLVMKEYWRRPRETAEVLAPGRWLRTGDVGRLDADGYLFLEARKRDLILRGAENVYPVEIEQCLEAHPDVAEAAVVGVPHDELGQEVKAVVVPRAGLDEAQWGALEAKLAAHCRERLAYFKVPAHWELRRAPLPRNATGKVLKHLLTDGGPSPFVDEA